MRINIDPKKELFKWGPIDFKFLKYYQNSTSANFLVKVKNYLQLST
jgi:hypothetical protein